MGIAVNGAGNPNAKQVITGTVTVKNASDPLARMEIARKAEKKVKKPLNYNHREISGQLLRAKKAQTAATTLTRAKSKLAVLQRAAGSGQYNEKEIANAIAHARRMVRCAQLKVRNLREEEREQNAHQNESGARNQQKKNEVKRRVAAKERELERKIAMAKQQAEVLEKRKRSEMMQKRRAHRNQENEKITEADLKYLKGQIENGRLPGGTNYSQDGSVVVDLSCTAAAMNEVAMLEQQIQTQVEAEVEAEMAMGIGGMDISAGTAPAMLQGNTAGDLGAGTAEAGSVNISI